MKPVPAQVKVRSDEEEISEEAVGITLRRALSFYSTLQAEDGFWPGDYGGPLFLLPGLVRLISIFIYLFIIFYTNEIGVGELNLGSRVG